MSDNPLIKAFIKLHEDASTLEEKVGPRPNQPASTTSSAEGLAMGRGAVNNITMGAGKYGRAAVDYGVKNLGSLAGMSEPTTFDKELEQEKEKDTAAKRDYPDAYRAGETAATVAQLATGAGAAKVLASALAKTAAKNAAARNARWQALQANQRNAASRGSSKKVTADNFEMGVGRLNQFPDEVASSMKPYVPPPTKLPLTQQMRVPKTPPASLPPLPLTKQMLVPGTRKVIPFPKNTRLTTEEQNDLSKGNTEMSINPFIKGFFDIEEARAKNTNIFDESKKLTAAQKKHLDKNNNDKIDAEDFKMLRKEEAEQIDEVSNIETKYVQARIHPRFDAMVTTKNGKTHSVDDKPAIVRKNGDKFWFKNGNLHRDDGPAQEWADGEKYWYKNGKFIRSEIPGDKPPLEETTIKKDHKIVEGLNTAANKMKEEAETSNVKSIMNKLTEEELSELFNFMMEEAELDEAKTLIDTKSDWRYDKSATAKNWSHDKLMKVAKHDRSVEKEIKRRIASKEYIFAKEDASVYEKEEVEFSEEEIDFINNVMEAMPVAPTSENDSPNPTPKKKAEGSRAKGSMAD